MFTGVTTDSVENFKLLPLESGADIEIATINSEPMFVIRTEKGEIFLDFVSKNCTIRHTKSDSYLEKITFKPTLASKMLGFGAGFKEKYNVYVNSDIKWRCYE